MGADTSKVSRFFEQRFGRSSRGALDLTRIMAALVGLVSGLTLDPGSPNLIPTFVYGILVAWSLLIIVMPIISWQLDMRLTGLVLTADLAIIALIIIWHQHLTLFVLPYSLLLFLTMHRAFMDRLQLAAIVGACLLIAVFGTNDPPLLLHAKIDVPILVRLLFVLLCLLVVVSVRSRLQYIRKFRLWSDGLLISGTHSQAIPLEFMLERIAARYPGSRLIWLENEVSDNPRIMCLDNGELLEMSTPAAKWLEARNWMMSERAFMFDIGRLRVLHRAEVESPEVNGDVDREIEFMAALGLAGYGMSFPVRVAEDSARVFIAETERPSVQALREVIEVGRAAEALFERFHFQGAWRERAYLEARTALGRDLHDTVLQTMASLRMQIAAILSRPTMAAESEVRTAILQLQSTVAEEQRTFREILDEGHRASSEAVELNAILANRLLALSKQWGIDCAFMPSADDLMVDGNTAVEVEFIIREVVSNSVQHGRAKNITVRISIADGMLLLAITNEEDRPRELIENGTDGEIKSKSLARRLTSIRASAYADGVIKGSLLSIRIPLSRN
ncbi:sensor histidine kinase [Aquisediminimonas profunda]|uniref:sensor histidine kinase n=1 Tax=Aquisediminimonas profunda TaxID=1550733 RepID=UPI001C639EBD|nr:histidine kinase [Aquisediminimonas profunda]